MGGDEVGVLAFEQPLVERPPDDRDDVALLGRGDVGLGEGLGRQSLAVAEGQPHGLCGGDQGIHVIRCFERCTW